MNDAFDWAAYHWPRLQRRLEPPPLLLIEHGRLRRRAMRREMIGVEELMSQLRAHGIERLSDVARAYMESDGRVSVIRNEDAAGGGTARAGDAAAQPRTRR